MKEYKLPKDVLAMLDKYGFSILGMSHKYLYLSTTFYSAEDGDLIDWLLDGKWGFARDPYSICMMPEFFRDCRNISIFCSKLFHELVHIAQMRVDGRHKFRRRYFWQWVFSGFSYDRMKKRGYELEAVEAEEKFYRKTQGYIE